MPAQGIQNEKKLIWAQKKGAFRHPCKLLAVGDLLP